MVIPPHHRIHLQNTGHQKREANRTFLQFSSSVQEKRSKGTDGRTTLTLNKACPSPVLLEYPGWNHMVPCNQSLSNPETFGLFLIPVIYRCTLLYMNRETRLRWNKESIPNSWSNVLTYRAILSQVTLFGTFRNFSGTFLSPAWNLPETCRKFFKNPTRNL